MSDTEWPLWSAEHPLPPGEEPIPVTPVAPADAPTPSATIPQPDAPAQTTPCPHCGVPVATSASFCESCGGELTPTQPAPANPATVGSGQTRRLGDRASAVAACPSCGGTVGADGYCQTCGAKAPSARDHFEQSPASWVGGVCDRGIQHHRNEDALATWAEGDRAVLVVCDGVSTSIDSDVASLAGARAALEVLVASTSVGVGGDETRDAAAAHALVKAAAAANQAVVDTTAIDSTNAASATFAAAVVSPGRVDYANLGDSRVYLLGSGEPLLLSVDDSMAQAFIAEGMPRAEAESMPRAHAITKWLGRDSSDIVPRTGVHELTEPAWLVVCSDGLWNYASSPQELAEQVAAASAESSDPTAIAQRLVSWANAQGGQDNITVALARFPGSAASEALEARSSLEQAPIEPSGKEQPIHG